MAKAWAAYPIRESFRLVLQRTCNRCGSNKHLANASDQLLKLNAINNCICQSSTLFLEVLPEVQICNTNCDNFTDRIKCLVRISTEPVYGDRVCSGYWLCGFYSARDSWLSKRSVINARCKSLILVPKENDQARAELPTITDYSVFIYISLKSWQHLFCSQSFTHTETSGPRRQRADDVFYRCPFILPVAPVVHHSLLPANVKFIVIFWRAQDTSHTWGITQSVLQGWISIPKGTKLLNKKEQLMRLMGSAHVSKASV